MEKTKFQSYKNGELARGCQMCVRGRSLVLFITGICPLSCYFCPLSEKKYHKDVIYANERPITDLKDIIEEARLSGARACGITGGDPLAKLERTIRAIKLLKKAFKNFYIHLYTPLELVTPEKIRALEEAGLDENTIVIYTSDQGFYLGEHGWFDKRWMYKESLRTPLLVKWPGVIKAGTENSELVSNLDFAETFLDLAETNIPDDLFAEIEQQVMKETFNTLKVPSEDSDNKQNLNKDNPFNILKGFNTK